MVCSVKCEEVVVLKAKKGVWTCFGFCRVI